jgi:hypothetical protein
MTDTFESSGAAQDERDAATRLEPVLLEVVRVCHFKRKPCGICGLPKSNRVHTPEKTAECPFRRQNGCANCGGTKKDRAHFGAPESFNVLASGQGSGNAMIYANLKANWQEILTAKLVESGLPRGLQSVFVEGEITFPDRREDRDQGNFRVVLEKALGDALENGSGDVPGGWLVNDSWDHYEFGQLTKRVVPGESATRLMLFPNPAPYIPSVPRPGEQLEIR